MNFDLDHGDFILRAESESIPKNYLNDTISDVNNDTMEKFNFNLSTVQPSPENDSSLDMQWEYIGFGIPGTRENARIIHYCFGTLLILIGFCGVIGNGLVLYVFTRFTRRLRGGGSTLILSLATGDFLVSLFHFAPAYASFHERWTFGERGCEIYAAMVGLSGMASLLTLSAIAADRYGVIIGQPLLWLSAKKTCAAIWFFCLILTAPPFFGWSRYVKEGLETSCSWDYKTRDWNNRSYYIFLLLFGFTIPVVIITYSYIGIIHVVCKHSKKMSGVTRNGVIHNKKRLTKSDIRTAQVILTIIICFLTSWTPYALVSLVGQFGDERGLSPLATALPAVFAKASVVYNPIVYGLSHPHFRSAIRMLKARHFPNNSSTNRASGPYDRYHYYPGGHLNSMKKSGNRKNGSFNEGQRQNQKHNHNNHRRHRHRQQRNGKDLAGLFRQPSNSQYQQSDGGGNSRTFEISRSSGGGGGTDIMVNRKGWTVVRRISPPFDSGSLQSSFVGIGNGSPISGIDRDSHHDPESYSEPDLVQRVENEKVKHSECISVCECRKGKKRFLRKAFFSSESCLEKVLVEGKRGKRMFETDSSTRKNCRKYPHSIVKKSMIVFSTAGIGTGTSTGTSTSTINSSSKIQTKCSHSSKLDLTLDDQSPSQDGRGAFHDDNDDDDGSNDIYVANDCQQPNVMTKWPVSPSDSSNASSCCNDVNRNSGSVSSISNILCVSKKVTNYSSTNTNTNINSNTNTNTNTTGKTNGHNNKKYKSEKVELGPSSIEMDIIVQTKTDGLRNAQAPNAIIEDINTYKNGNNCTSSSSRNGNCKSRRRAFWQRKSIPSSLSLSSFSSFSSPSRPSSSSPNFKYKTKAGGNSKKSKSKCSSPWKQRLVLLVNEHPSQYGSTSTCTPSSSTTSFTTIPKTNEKKGGNNETQVTQQKVKIMARLTKLLKILVPHQQENETFELELEKQLSSPPSSTSLPQKQQQQQQQQQDFNELDLEIENTVLELQKSCNELRDMDMGMEMEKITSIEFQKNCNPEQTNEYSDAIKDQMNTWKMTLTNEYQQRQSFKIHRHVSRELSRISSESEDQDDEDDDDADDDKNDEEKEIQTRIPSKKLDKVQNNTQGQRKEDDGVSESEQDEILSVHTIPYHAHETCEDEEDCDEIAVGKVLHREMDR